MLALCGLLFYFVEPGSSLFSWHPTLMTVGAMLVCYEGNLLLAPKKGLLEGSKRATQKNVHGFLQFSGAILMFLGFLSCAMHKNAVNKPHFATPHAIAGGVAGILTCCQLIGGVAVKFQLGPVSPKYMKFGHTGAALAQYLLICMAYMGGIFSNYMTARTTPFVQIVLLFLPILAYGTSLAHVLNRFLQIIIKPK